MKKSISKKELPTIGFCFISYNDEKIVRDCLESIKKQDYPKEKIDILFVDGGSNDKTISIIKEYGARVISRPDLKDHPHIRGEISTSTLKNELLFFMSCDNRLQEKNCLSNMVAIFNDQEIVGVETLRYGFEKTDPPLSRYFALIGGADPIAVGLGKADRGPHDRSSWHTGGKSADKKNYFEVTFPNDISKIPTMGGNGFMVRRRVLEEVGGFKNSLHIETCVKMIRSGHKKYGFLKNNHIIHYINIPVLTFLKRRIIWAASYSSDNMKREYSVFNRKDWYKLLLIIIFYMTIIIPFLRALKGYIRKPDAAWFLHVVVCPVFVVGYGFFFIKSFCKKIEGKLS